MSKHDFKAALEKLQTKGRVRVLGSDFFFSTQECETIQTALRIADRLQSGEVSDGMLQVAHETPMNLPDWNSEYREEFKAMANQLIKECEND